MEVLSMKNLFKIIGFIGALAAGAAGVSYFMKSSQSVVSTQPFQADTSVQVINQSTKPVKLSRLAKIEQNYQPKPFEEIPVEFVQIVSSDIDEGRKFAQEEQVLATDKVVKVDKGPIFSLSSHNSVQQPVQARSDDSSMVNPQNYYPDFFNNGMNYIPRQNTVASHDPAPASLGSSQTPTVNSAPEEKRSKERKNHFRDFNDDMDSKDSTKYTNPSVIPSLGADENISGQPVAPEVPQVEPANSNPLWKNILDRLATTAATYLGGKGLEYLWEKLFGNAAQKVSTDKVSTDQTVTLGNVGIEPKHIAGLVGAGLGLAAAAKIRSYMNSKPTQTGTVVEPVTQAERPKPQNLRPKQYLVNNNLTPVELLNMNNNRANSDNQLPKARPGISKSSEASSLPEVSNGLSSVDRPIKKLQSRSGIIESIDSDKIIELSGQPAIETQAVNMNKMSSRLGITQGFEIERLAEINNDRTLADHSMNQIKARPGIGLGSEVQSLSEVSNGVSSVDRPVKQLESRSRSGIVESIHPDEIIELPGQQAIEAQADAQVIELPVQEAVAAPRPSYLQTVWNSIARLGNTSRIMKSAPLALGLLGLSAVPGLIASACTPGALATTAFPAVATAATTALVPAATTTLAPTTAGLASYVSGAGALIAAKALVGLGCFAVTKNPVYLLPK
jgi:hypothetical protein